MLFIESVNFHNVDRAKFGLSLVGCQVAVEDLFEACGKPVLELLQRKNIVWSDATVETFFESFQILTTTQGRHDILMTISDSGTEMIDMSKDIEVLGIGWIKDFLVDYKDDYDFTRCGVPTGHHNPLCPLCSDFEGEVHAVH